MNSDGSAQVGLDLARGGYLVHLLLETRRINQVATTTASELRGALTNNEVGALDEGCVMPPTYNEEKKKSVGLLWLS